VASVASVARERGVASFAKFAHNAIPVGARLAREGARPADEKLKP
jgi:hypothetical protein